MSSEKKLVDLSAFNPDEWGVQETEARKGAATIPEPEKKDPTPKPEDVAMDVKEAPIEKKRTQKELVVAPSLILDAAPPQKPCAILPEYRAAGHPAASKHAVRVGEVMPSVDRLFELYCPEVCGGPSLFGWSRIKMARLCLRSFFWRYVLGLVSPLPRKREEPDKDYYGNVRLNTADVGIVFHAVSYMHHRTGGKHTWAPLYAIQGVYPELALEVHRLFKAYWAFHGEGDSQNKDIRGLEVEARYYFTSRKVAGKQRRLCASTRFDQLFHELRSGEGRAPVGQPADGITIEEHKTTGSTANLTLSGYRNDVQAILHIACLKAGLVVQPNGELIKQTVEQVYGPPSSLPLELDWVVKVKKIEPGKHLVRQPYAIPDTQVAHVMNSLGLWLYDELFARLFHKKWREAETWPCSWLCQKIHYTSWECPYLMLCDASLSVDPDELFDRGRYVIEEPEVLVLPKKLAAGKAKKRRRSTASVEDK